jgi:hypothetical protein
VHEASQYGDSQCDERLRTHDCQYNKFKVHESFKNEISAIITSLQTICTDANSKALFDTYDVTKACFGILLLGLGTVTLGVKEKGTHGALWPVGILRHGKRGERKQEDD